MDPRTKEMVSMQKAVTLGIINPNEGTYVNPMTHISMPIPQAMNEGLIAVEFTSTKKSLEKRSDVGLITIRTHRESRPYTVKAVLDAESDEQLTVDQAIANGILDQANGIYKNKRDKMDMSLADALDSGLLIVEFDESAKLAAPESVTVTYAIHAVVDMSTKSKVTFAEAVRNGLINTNTGAYFNNVTRKEVYVSDAIRKGFIKATIMNDPSSLDIAPENKIVAEKMASIRKQLLNPLKAVAALKRAATDNGDKLARPSANENGK